MRNFLERMITHVCPSAVVVVVHDELTVMGTGLSIRVPLLLSL